MDVINPSWGSTTAYADNFASSAFTSSKLAILNAVASGGGGLGTDIVLAAGNGQASGDDVNYHGYVNLRHRRCRNRHLYGKLAAFSAPGAALLVSARGTAKSDDDIGAAGYSSADYTTSPALPT